MVAFARDLKEYELPTIKQPEGSFMKVSRIIGVLSLAAAFAFIAGCSKQEQPAAGTAPAASAPEKPAAAADKPAVQAAPAIAPVAAADTATAASSQAQGLIDKAKSLVDSN